MDPTQLELFTIYTTELLAVFEEHWQKDKDVLSFGMHEGVLLVLEKLYEITKDPRTKAKSIMDREN